MQEILQPVIAHSPGDTQETEQSYQVFKAEGPNDLAIRNPAAKVASVIQHKVYL